MRYAHPHVIRTDGEELTFVAEHEDEEGRWLEVRNRVAPGKGPPMHVHYRQEESLTVTKGRIGYQVEGEAEQFAEEGETVHFPAGTPHRFWNAGSEEMECSGYIRPPENVEYFLTEIYDSINRSGGRRPDPFDAAFLLGRYRTEFGMNDIPGFVVGVIFPIQRFVGGLLGRFRRYRDAPEPMPATTTHRNRNDREQSSRRA